MNPTQSSEFLSPRDIAAWQIPTVSRGTSKIIARLPALQRGAVWKASQVEALWDSVLRGFPIGSFVLAPFDAARGQKDFLHQEKGVTIPDATHHLLDGQQRSNAFALGFLNPWSMESPAAALWIDLQKPAPNDEREFVLRLLTRSHPWGFHLNSLTSDGPRLSASMIREAVTAFEEASSFPSGKSGGQIPLKHAWPWQSEAPVPFFFLLDAVDNGEDVRTFLIERLSQLPFWASKEFSNWQQRITRILTASSGSDFDYLERLIRRAKVILGKDGNTSYQIAALIVRCLDDENSEGAPSKAAENGDEDPQDAMETLFIRINAGGTQVSGEELIYSILKSIWPDAEDFIQKMEVRLALPSRIVVLASRLVLSDVAASEPPAPLSIARFRRLIGGHGEMSDFRSKLLSFFENEATDVFAESRDLLTKNNRLPLSLAADIAHRSPNVMFLLLRWVQRMLKAGFDPRELDSKKTLRLLGAITALSWFSKDDKRCLGALWPALQSVEGEGIKTFFSAKRFVKAFKRTDGQFGLLPLVPPNVLESAIESNVFGRGFDSPASDLWESWTWEKLTERSIDDRVLGKKLHRWYKRSFKKLWDRTDNQDEEALDVGSLYQQAWKLFVDKLKTEKALVLFAQRKWLVDWLANVNYDPAGADQVEETDTPWDFDHIHPSSLITAKWNVPERIRAWHGSIGNLRAWPLSVNRGDGNDPPQNKFSAEQFSETRARERLKQFCIESKEDLLKASFVDDKNLKCWELSTPPEEEDYPHGYLGKPDEFGEQRKYLVRAIVGRWLGLYRNWYETMRIGDLCP